MAVFDIRCASRISVAIIADFLSLNSAQVEMQMFQAERFNVA